MSRSQGHSPSLLKVTQPAQLLQWLMIVWLLRDLSSLLWSSPYLQDSLVSSWEVTGRQPSLSLTMMVKSLHYCIQLLAAFKALPLILFVVVSVELANRSIEVSEAVGEVTVCLLKNSTTAMDFNVTVASLESSPVSAEGM